MDTVKTYPDLSAHCLKERLDLPLRLWYLLRQSCPCGWLLDLEVFRLSCGNKRQTRAWLRAGEGIFWTKAGNRLFLAGLKSVAVALGVKPRRAPVFIEMADIEDLARFRAALFASWFADAGEEGRVISQAALAEIFGRTDRTLRTWAKLAGLGVVHNLAQAPVPKPGDDLSKYPAGTVETLTGGAVKTWFDDPRDRPNLVWFERRGDDLVLTWRMANTYISTLARGRRTTLQKIAARHAPDPMAAGANVKLYWRQGSDGRAIARVLQRRDVVCLEGDTTKTGERLWSYLA